MQRSSLFFPVDHNGIVKVGVEVEHALDFEKREIRVHARCDIRRCGWQFISRSDERYDIQYEAWRGEEESENLYNCVPRAQFPFTPQPQRELASRIQE